MLSCLIGSIQADHRSLSGVSLIKHTLPLAHKIRLRHLTGSFFTDSAGPDQQRALGTPQLLCTAPNLGNRFGRMDLRRRSISLDLKRPGLLHTHTHSERAKNDSGNESVRTTQCERKTSLSDWPPGVFHSSPPSSSTPALVLHADWNMQVWEIGLRALRLGRAYLGGIDLCYAHGVKMEMTEPMMPLIDAGNDAEELEEGSDECILHSFPTLTQSVSWGTHRLLPLWTRQTGNALIITALFQYFIFSLCIQPKNHWVLIGRTTALHIILNCPQPKKAPNVKMETLSALFHKLFLFIGSLHNFKIGHTSGWLPCHGTFCDPQSFLDVSTPSTLEQSFCLFNGENSARVRPLFALYCTGFVTGEIVSFSPDHAFH